jgi:hypothetical protein
LPDLNGPAAAKSAPSGARPPTAAATARAARLQAVRGKLRPFGTRGRALP